MVIQDLTEQDLVHLRRTIYLTIMSSATFEECVHKLAKMDIPPGREVELINMIIECCSQERTFLRYYGLISGRFCLLDERWQDAFESAFATQYATIHRLETNKLRNVAKLFGHLLHTDSVSWRVLKCIHLNEDETTSSSRIFIKILVQEMAEAMGMSGLKSRFDTDNSDPDGELAPDSSAFSSGNDRRGGPHEETSRDWFRGLFPRDNARNTRYAINFFTSIGLGPLTDGMREFLKNAPKLILAASRARAEREAAAGGGGGDGDESSVISTSSSDTSSFSSSSGGSSGSSSSGSSSGGSSRSSYSSSSYSSDSRRGRSRGRRRRRRSYSSSSSSSSSSGSEDSRRRGGRSRGPSPGGRRRGTGDRDRRDGKGGRGRGGGRTPDSSSASRGSGGRSVSASPPRRGGGGRRGVGRSPSRSPRSRSRSRSPGRRGGRDGGDRRGTGKRGRSPSYDSRSRSASPPRKRSSRR